MTSKNQFHRGSIRLPGVDYSEPGAYFLTICAARQQQIFGSIHANRIVLSPLGEVVRKCWMQIPQHFSQASLKEFVMMPNHLHGIIGLTVGARYIVPLAEHAPERFQKPVKGSIPTIVRTFKAAVTRDARVSLGWKDQIWPKLFRARVARRQGIFRCEPVHLGESLAMEMGQRQCRTRGSAKR